MKASILLVSPPESYRIQPYVRAAQSLGIKVMLASQGEWALSTPQSAGIDVPLDDPQRAVERLLGLVRKHPFHAIIGTDDSTLEIAASLAAEIGLRQNPPSAVRRARRKDLSRRCLQQAGIPVPDFTVICSDDIQAVEQPQFGYPCVVKPLALSGSRGVIRADDHGQFIAACQRAAAIIREVADPFESNHLLVEKFVPGREYAVEGMLVNGKLELLALFDKPDPLDGPYFEETYYILPTHLDNDAQAILHSTVEQACAAFGLINGPVHAECRVGKDGPWLIELAARTIGGLCSRLLTFGTGYTLEQLVLANAIGQKLHLTRQSGGAGVLMLPIRESGVLRRVEGVLAAERLPGVDEVAISIREGYRIVPLPEGSSYLGFVFASGVDAAAVEGSLRMACQAIRPVIAPFWPVDALANSAKKKATA